MNDLNPYSYVARQPILDINQACVGYELLFRDGPNNAFPNIDADQATSRIIADSQFNLSLEDLTGNYPAFINFPELSLLKRLPELLPPEQIVIEILETVAPSEKLASVLAALQQKGYRIALDDFNYTPSLDLLLPYVDIVKIDVLQHGISGLPGQIAPLSRYDVVLLAEKVETHQQFEASRKLGFTLFQGYFFARPEIIRNRQIKPYQLTMLELFSATSEPDIDFNKVEKMIREDVSLSYKLLRFVNSVYFYRKSPIATLRQALIYLGAHQLRDFVLLLATSGIATDKPRLLASMAIIRGHFAKGIAELHRPDLAEQAYIVGLFSLLPALLDRPMDSIIKHLNLEQQINQALLDTTGPLGNYLSLCRLYEKADWPNIEQMIQRLQISLDDLSQHYHQTVQWADQLYTHVPSH